MTFLTIFLLTMPNATAKTIGLFTAFGQFAGFLLEVPSGYIADRVGHKNALIMAKAAMVISTLCYVLASSTGWFFVGAAFMSLGFAFTSGTGSAFMHETLRDLGKEGKYAKIMGKIQSIGFGIPVIFIVVLPVLAETSFRLAFAGALVIDVVGLAVTCLLVRPSARHAIEEISIDNLKKTFVSWYNTGWFRYIVVMALIFGVGFGASAGFKNPFQESLGLSVTILGLFWALSRAVISIGSLAAGWIYRTFTFKQFLVLKTFIEGFAFLIIGLLSNVWIIAVLFIIPTAINWGTKSALDQYLLEFIKGSGSKATLLSVNSLIQKLCSVLGSLGMGFLVAGYSYHVAYFIAGSILVSLGVVSWFYLSQTKTSS